MFRFAIQHGVKLTVVVLIICLIGVLSGARADLLIPLIGSRNVNLQGVSVGTRESLEDMMRGIATNRIKPVIDRVFSLEDARAALKAGFAALRNDPRDLGWVRRRLQKLDAE